MRRAINAAANATVRRHAEKVGIVKKLLFEFVLDDLQEEREVDAADIFVIMRRSFPKSLVSVEAVEQSMHQTGLTPRQKKEVEQIVMRALSTGSV